MVRSATRTTVTSASWNGIPLNFEVAAENDDSGASGFVIRSELWGAPIGSTSGLGTLIINFSAANFFLAIGVTTHTGVDQATPINDRQRAAATSNLPSVGVTTGINGEVALDAVSTFNVITGPTNLLLWNQGFGGSSQALAPAPSPVTMSWNLSSAQPWAISAMTLRPVSFTRANVEQFVAYRSATEGAVVEWRTGTEHATVGYHLMKLDDATGEFVQLNDTLLPSIPHSTTGGVYRFRDREADLGEINVYQLVEVELTGARNTYGPYSVIVDVLDPEDDDELITPAAGLLAALDTQATLDELLSDTTDDESTLGSDDEAAHEDDDAPAYTSEVQTESPRVRSRTIARATARATKRAERGSRRGPQLKVVVKEAGLYFVDAQTIADKLGISLARVHRHLRDEAIELRNRGARVATSMPADASGLYFFGEAIDSQYTEENVYFLGVGAGLSMRRRDGGLPVPVSGLAHRATSHAEGNQYSLTHLFDDADGDYWMWDYRFGGFDFPSCDTNPQPCTLDRFVVPSPARAGEGAAELVVRLHGATDAPHRVTVTFNDIELGVAEFEGMVPHLATFELDPSLLVDGDNEVRIDAAASGEPMPSFIYINDFDLSYRRYYVAEAGELLATRSDHDVVTVTGFERDSIRVLDLTDARRPVIVDRTRVDEDGGRYRASFAAPGAFLALDASAVRTPELVYADRPSRLHRRNQRVDWLAITGTSLLDAAGELAAHRASQGLRVAVVDIEDIYDEFNHGIADPDAVWAFLRYAHRRWRLGPRYVLLAGEGSFDYKDYLGHGDAIVPTLLTATDNGLFPSDNLYADVVGNDWSPEFAIGRLPVIDAAEMSAMAAKIVAYETADADAWTRRVTLAADRPDAAGDFTLESEAIAALVPEDYEVERIHLEDLAPAEARALMLDAVNEGSAFVNFVGHSGYLGLGNANLLTVFDVPDLDNGVRLPVLTALTCLAGQFGYPGQDFLGESLVTKVGGGAIAVWSPSGMSKNYRARVLGQAFYRATFADGELVLGEAILAAQRHYAAEGEDREMLDLYNLIGDPALVIK